jgi:single-strand DNA-binding protein
MNMNKVDLIGNLAQDPELRYTANNTAVTTLTVATNENYKDKDGKWQSKAEFHRVSVWGPQAENCSKYLIKGQTVMIEGALHNSRYQDKDGVTRFQTQVKATTVKFGPKAKHNGPSQQEMQFSDIPDGF